ncbi:MAG: FHA domain-containing protein [Capsulimonadaceae bacterium]
MIRSGHDSPRKRTSESLVSASSTSGGGREAVVNRTPTTTGQQLCNANGECDPPEAHSWDAAPPALKTNLPAWTGARPLPEDPAPAASGSGTPQWTGAAAVYNNPPQWNPQPEIDPSAFEVTIRTTVSENALNAWTGTDVEPSECAPDSVDAGPRVACLSGVVAGKSFAIVGQTRIGRAEDNDIILAEPSVSRHHVVLCPDERGRITVVDASSSNGVYVNGVRIVKTLIDAGDNIRIGNCHFRFEV